MQKYVKIILPAIIFAGSWLFAAHGEARSITARGEILEDARGRQVLLRGINAGGRSKFPPFLPFDPGDDFDSALEKYADNVRAMGFNLVRLLVIYEAAEPIRGEYDRAYLEKYDAMVEAFAKRDIYIIVDGHQDLFSRRFHGDGFPDWAVPEAYRENEQTNDRKIWNRGYLCGRC